MRARPTLLVLVAIASSCKPATGEPVTCGSFSGGGGTAAWTECSDKVERAINCKPFVVRHQMAQPRTPAELKCDCLEDTVVKSFFIAKDMPLDRREDATRIANANCRWKVAAP